MQIINVKKLLSENHGLDIVKDYEEESDIKLIKRKYNKKAINKYQLVQSRYSVYEPRKSIYNWECHSYYFFNKVSIISNKIRICSQYSYEERICTYSLND